MKNQSAAANLRKNITIQKHSNGAISLRSTKTSEISNFVKNCNLAETNSLRKELNIWHKDTSFEVRKMSRQCDNMYRSLLRLSKAKKEIKADREEKKKDREDQKVWRKSDRRRMRRNKISVSRSLQELPENDEVAQVAQANYLKIDHDDQVDNPVVTADARPVQTGTNRLAPLTVGNLNDFNRKSKSPKNAESLSPEVAIEGNESVQSRSEEKKTKETKENITESPELASKTDKRRFSKPPSNTGLEAAELGKIDASFNGAIEPEFPGTAAASPVPGLSLKPAYLVKRPGGEGKQGFPRRSSVLPGRRPAHLERLKSTKFIFLHSSAALIEDEELETENSENRTVSESFGEIGEGRNSQEAERCHEETNFTAQTSETEFPEPTDDDIDDDVAFPSVSECNDVYGEDPLVLPPIGASPSNVRPEKRKRKRKRIKLKQNKVDPSEELNKRSSIQIRPGRTYEVTVYKKNGKGSLEEDQASLNTTIDVAKYFNLASHKERLQRKKLLDDARDKETQQRHRVTAFLRKLSREMELSNKDQFNRRREAEEARLALQRRLEAIKRGPPKYGAGDSSDVPSYVRSYVKVPKSNRPSQVRKRSSWSVPSLFTLQFAASSRTGSSLLNTSLGSGRASIIPDSSSHLVNINIDKYLLSAAAES